MDTEAGQVDSKVLKTSGDGKNVIREHVIW
jgi:hypothetical protein